ncbi:hypothetical protein ACFX1Q_026420 [Malus domestica]
MGRDRRGWRPFRKFQSRESVGPRYLLRPVRKFQSSELEEKYRVMNIEVDDHPTPELPSEIIFTHILPRLPPTFLIKQCSRVCKSWSSLIRHHSFVTAYRNFQCSKGTTNFLLRKGDRFFSSQLNQEGNLTPATRLSTIDIELIYHYSAVRSLDGLLVIGSYGDDPVTISNPSTGESIQLPHEKIDRKICPTYHIGFTPFTNEYKVLQILFGSDEKGDTNITLNIFTLGMDYSWRPLQVDVGDLPFDLQHPPFDMRSDRRSVCLHGAIHWLHEQSQSILVFDLGDEAFRVIPLPQEYDYTREWEWDDYSPDIPIVEVGGCVGVFVDDSRKQNPLWILKDYQNHVWVKETIPVPSTVRRYYDRWKLDCFGTIGAGDDLLLEVTLFGYSPGFDDSPPEYYLYNMKSKHERTLDFTFPTGMPSVYDDPEEPMKLIASYEDSIIPLKLHNSVTES